MNIFKRKPLNLADSLKTWSDHEVLENFSLFCSRIGIANHLIPDQNGFYTHQVLEIQCGDLSMKSAPQELDWPLEPIVMPDVPKEMIN